MAGFALKQDQLKGCGCPFISQEPNMGSSFWLTFSETMNVKGSTSSRATAEATAAKVKEQRPMPPYWASLCTVEAPQYKKKTASLCTCSSSRPHLDRYVHLNPHHVTLTLTLDLEDPRYSPVWLAILLVISCMYLVLR
jgi:hypothetical protein